MAKSYRHRLQRERDVRDMLNATGWVAFRTAKEIADVIALASPAAIHPYFGAVPLDTGPLTKLLVQVKTTVHPYGAFGPSDRAALVRAAKRARASAWLVWQPPRASDPVWIASFDWPRAGQRIEPVKLSTTMTR